MSIYSKLRWSRYRYSNECLGSLQEYSLSFHWLQISILVSTLACLFWEKLETSVKIIKEILLYRYHNYGICAFLRLTPKKKAKLNCYSTAHDLINAINKMEIELEGSVRIVPFIIRILLWRMEQSLWIISMLKTLKLPQTVWRYWVVKPKSTLLREAFKMKWVIYLKKQILIQESSRK